MWRRAGIGDRHADRDRAVRAGVLVTLDVVGPGRILFGTDSSFFPRGWQHAIFEDQARALYEAGLSAADAELIFSANLLRIMAR